jgi:hypothetical protein
VGQTKSLLFCDDRTLVIDCATAIGDVALSVGITLLPLSHATLGVIRPKKFPFEGGPPGDAIDQVAPDFSRHL